MFSTYPTFYLVAKHADITPYVGLSISGMENQEAARKRAEALGYQVISVETDHAAAQKQVDSMNDQAPAAAAQTTLSAKTLGNE